MPVPSNIKDYYYKKWDNFYCCYKSIYHNLGAAWPAFGGIHDHIKSDVIVVPYDAIKFDRAYFEYTLEQHLQYANESGMFVIIDKTVEHVHSKLDFYELYSNLQKFKLLDRCVVFDNTKDETMYEKYNVPHAYAPWYVWFYIFFKRIPNYSASPRHQFLCLNNLDKSHRFAMIQTLHKKNFIKRTLWSYRQPVSPYSKQNVVNICPELQDVEPLFDAPHFIDQPEGEFNQEKNLQALYNDALISIVTETDFLYDNTQFATEKSWNSIFYGTIPIVLSCKGTVDVMREHGIDVYDDLIDHSYDEEPDAIKRYDKVVACIDQAVGWRNYGQMMSLIAKRQIRNQILLTHDQHWIMEIDNSVGKFFEQNKISI